MGNFTINIEHIRAETEDYRRSFCKKWKEVYGSGFAQDTRKAMTCAKEVLNTSTQNELEEYTNKIRFIKSLIEQQP